MQVQNVNNQLISADKASNSSTSEVANFSRELEHQHFISQKMDTSATDNNIKLGTLSDKNTSVAHLLLANPELKSKTWSIIHHSINQKKAFHQIPVGKDIYYNPTTQALIWSGQKSANRAIKSLDSSEKNMPLDQQKMILGQINRHNPTVLSLLSQQSDYNLQRWDIIHSKINQGKEFTKISSDTTIYIDTNTREISWDIPSKRSKKPSKVMPLSHHQISDNSTILVKKLDDAVKPFMGINYKDIDCYTLVVNGLENMGVRYRGQDSLSRQLVQMAQTEGRANNAYFTGEGITEAIGKKIYTHAITRVNNIEQQSKAIFQEMKSLMKKGDILSFSLESRGHTGVISQNQKQWTYINSGRLDHSISQNSPKHGVGEETLLSEINNWIKLAHKHNESLQITVGRLDSHKWV